MLAFLRILFALLIGALGWLALPDRAHAQNYPACQATNAGGGVCLCPDGGTLSSGPNALSQCPSLTCGDDQLAVNGACVCKRLRYVPDPATGVCGCPRGQVDTARPGQPAQCMPACPAGQRYNTTADGNVVCGPDCGADAMQLKEGGACVCRRAGTTFDPNTLTCGCPSGQVDVARPGQAAQCKAACPAGQRYNTLADGRVACGPDCGADAMQLKEGGACVCRRAGTTFDPNTLTCGCPAGQVDVSRPNDGRALCKPACPAGQRYNTLADARVACGPDCGADAMQLKEGGACVCRRAGTTFDPNTLTCGCPAGQVDVSRPNDGRALCKPACPAGQRYNVLPDARVACGPDCGTDATQLREGGACVCRREGTIFDPNTRTCGCPAGQVDVPGPGQRAQCRPACPAGQQYNILPDAKLACGPDCGADAAQLKEGGACVCRQAGAIFDPKTRTCGPSPCPPQQEIGPQGTCVPTTAACPLGTASINGACVNPCAPGQWIGLRGTCEDVPGSCPAGMAIINGVCATPCANNAPLGPDGKCPVVPQTKAPAKSKPKTTVDQVPRCPDGRIMPANGNCGVVGPQLFNPLGGLQLIFPGGGGGGGYQQQQQQPQQQPTEQKQTTPLGTCPDGSPKPKTGICPQSGNNNSLFKQYNSKTLQFGR